MICLHDVQIEQNPTEVPVNGIKISCAQPSEKARLFHFNNNEDAESWASVAAAVMRHL